ncbi:hypothetical protein EHI8A_002410 [Entamoeba histolytica HM-1:IMSS-B]|uniref:Wntless-like transmembrane domain-containing protein n=6 Tax=Entamoeba histolytica TaxID=5759 RepID=B1N3A0_ENTH1|nr:hypothetical protein EHI_135050 [Entamoeba histolytica HM-1:IMSS]EMD48603.1 Hypothetical protein EHI5A_009580 [Entamoeba histolytica KU27]EMH76442.1 hypothetical protein EHI8A_002410 [Entamoeba histolytica HM-1:IMSS-B]EMS14495.1 hypothetical protein KM1_008250 [Entamoeba histolytica HM-3:IMSS]ENY61276.1 hypothetical protein EHI7A_018030 [Entamoeba histolytica HM-1:IMSS-A]GAT94849.1 hypothetical protein CL6EHI_135050 [Entamoeba histolytica]|eukprot:XP_001913666.1 hypothetical protein EHI_135050 [Entamoeba histolytica HM-1:IMSS]
MPNGVIIDELGSIWKITLCVVWIICLIIGIFFSFGQILEIGIISNSTTFNVGSSFNGDDTVAFVSFVGNEKKIEGIVDSFNGMNIVNKIKEDKTDEIENELSSIGLKSSLISLEEDETSSSLSEGDTYYFFDVELLIKTYNQFQATTCKPYVKTDLNHQSVDKITISGNATFWWLDHPELNSFDNINKPVKFETQCSFTGGECNRFSFIYLRNVFNSSYTFIFFFKVGFYNTLVMDSKRGIPGYSLFKISFVTFLVILSVIATILYSILYFFMKLYKNDEDHFYINSFIMIILLNFYNNPFNILRFFFNADWISCIDTCIYTIYQIVLISFIFLHIDHSRNQALGKKNSVLIWILRATGLLAYFVFFLLYFILYYLPSNKSPFSVVDDTMSIGLMFGALSTFICFLLYGWTLIYMLFTYSEIRSPLYKNRIFWFSIFTSVVLIVTLLHLIFGQDMNYLPPISMICRQLLCNLYVYTLTFIFFPKEISNDDEYGITAYTQF